MNWKTATTATTKPQSPDQEGFDDTNQDPYLEQNIDVLTKDLPTVMCNSAVDNTSFSSLYLKDLTVKSAHNAALLNGYLHPRILETLVDRGVRAFDFQVFYQTFGNQKSPENTLVVGYNPDPEASTSEKSVLPLSEALDTLLTAGFSSQNIGNTSDPLFVKIRFHLKETDKSLQQEMYKKYKSNMDALKKKFSAHFLDKRVTSKTALNVLRQKVVFMLDSSVDFDLPSEYFNMAYNSTDLKTMTYMEVKEKPKSSEMLPRVTGDFTISSGSSFKIVMPDTKKNDTKSGEPTALPAEAFENYAPNFLFMRYYDLSEQLDLYEEIFGETFEYGILPIAFILSGKNTETQIR